MAIIRAVFITAESLMQETPANSDIDVAMIRNLIWETQEIKIRALLGCDLYDMLVLQKINDTVTSANETLIEQYIRPTLNNYVLAMNMPLFHYRLRNKGIVLQQGENTQSADYSEVNTMSRLFGDKAESFASLMLKFLNKNIEDYPLFLSSDNCNCSGSDSAYMISFNL